MLRALAILALIPIAAPAQAPLQKTTAERTGYKETSRHADVLAFGEQLAAVSPLVKATTYGTSGDGRPLPLLVLSDPGVSTPEEAAKLKRPVLFAFANIHAGEVDGKEALLALARDLVTEKSPLLKSCVLLIAPNINPDGNEAVSDKNRRSQNGPPAVGVRENAAGFDLNRDFVKLETPEIRALVKLLNRWDPLLVIDCHTTNGSRHRYTLTYDGPAYPAADARLIAAGRDRLLPAVSNGMKAAGFDTFYYGNFSADRTRWETYPATPRFGVQYFALRNRVGLLSESYSYAPFEQRVKASYQFVKAAFDHVGKDAEAWTKLAEDIEEPRRRVALRAKAEAFDKPVTVLGFDEKERDKPKDLELKFVGKLSPTLEVELPAAYLIPARFADAVQTLRRHGVTVDELREDVQFEVEAYTVEEMKRETRAFQKHALVSLEVAKAKATRSFPAGTLRVRTGQKLGALAAYLLEPQSEDGLAAWNFFDDALRPKGEYPVLRVTGSQPAFAGVPRPLPEDRVTGKPITPEFLQLGRGFTAGGGPNITWLPDGEHFTQSKDGKMWKVHARTGKAEPMTGGGAAGGRPPFGGRGGMPGPQQKQFLTTAPGGKHAAYVKNGNLVLIDNKSKEERPLTKDGGENVLNGKADWVYEEEIFNRNGKAYWWSPDGSKIAFLRFDDTPVKRFTLAAAFPNQGRAETYAYPKPGDPNPTVKLLVADVATASLTTLSLDAYKPDDTLISRVGWMPDGDKVFAYVQNRVQTWLDFTTWDAVTGEPTKLFRDQTKAWIEDPGEPRFLKDGSFLLPSERTGWKHLYHYAADGSLKRAVTTGEWEVKDVHRIDEEAGVLYVSGTKDTHTGSNLYRVKLDGSEAKRLTAGDGTHTVSVAQKGDLFVDRHTDSDMPARATLRTFDGQLVRTLDTNPVYERAEYKLGRYERAQIKTPDGFLLEAAVTYPPDFDPAKKYPVWLQTYAGPHAPTVRDSWGWRGFEQVLAGMGIVSFRVDPRSASGKGAVSAWACYRKMGVQELKDLETAVDWLTAKPWADSTRVGISGHSFGGYITAYALTHSTKFSAGIAGAPPTDWRLYDTIYTERYMGLPSENKAGYDDTSCIKAAANLHGKLLLVHGLMDDNVHFQNTAQFIDALQKANKPFEMMVYPQSRHGIAGAHYQRLQLDFIRKTMLGN